MITTIVINIRYNISSFTGKASLSQWIVFRMVHDLPYTLLVAPLLSNFAI